MTPGLAVAIGGAVAASALGSLVVFRRRGPDRALTRVVLVVLVAGLAVGTCTHGENLLRAGLVPRPELPLACNLFWSSLALVDPLVAGVLVLRPRLGVPMVLALMAVDLGVNLAFLGVTGPVVAQLGYAAVAVAAVPLVRRPA